MLNPSMKMSYFQKNWNDDLVKELTQSAEDIVRYLST